MKAIRMRSISNLIYLFIPEDSRDNHYSNNDKSPALNTIKTILWLGFVVAVTVALSHLS